MNSRLSKIRSVHTYVMSRTVYFDWICNSWTLFYFQAGTYTCTAYNDLDKLKVSVQLNVYYQPTCRIRNQETSDGGLNLRCDVDAFPPNVTYRWTHNDLPLQAADGPTLYYRFELLNKVKNLLHKSKKVIKWKILQIGRFYNKIFILDVFNFQFTK